MACGVPSENKRERECVCGTKRTSTATKPGNCLYTYITTYAVCSHVSVTQQQKQQRVLSLGHHSFSIYSLKKKKQHQKHRALTQKKPTMARKPLFVNYKSHVVIVVEFDYVRCMYFVALCYLCIHSTSGLLRY